MKRTLWLLAAVLLTIGCSGPQFTTRHTDKIYLRQLVNRDVTETHSSGAFFLIAGSVSSSTETETVVRVMGEVDGEYRFMQFNFEQVRIRIDNKVKTPYIVLNYFYYEPQSIDELLYYSYHFESVTIVCPEQYLPEKLLPIQI
jgi:hypothetical protein